MEAKHTATPQFMTGTAAQVLFDALTRYAEQTIGAERAAARNLAMQADVLAEAAQGGNWLSSAALSKATGAA